MIDRDIKHKFEQLFTNVELRPWAQRTNMRGTIDPFYRFLIAQCKEDDKWYQVEAKMPVSEYQECVQSHSGKAERLDRVDEQLMLRLIEVAAKEKKERRDARKPN